MPSRTLARAAVLLLCFAPCVVWCKTEFDKQSKMHGHHQHIHGPGCAHQRGAVIYPDDVMGEGMVQQWTQWLQEGRLNYLGLHGPAPEATPAGPGVMSFLGSPTQKHLAAAMANISVSVEYELHSFGYLLPRSLFPTHPEYFRQDASGKRNPDVNFCTGSTDGLEVVAENAVTLALTLNQSNPRFHFWQDDGGGDAWCSCPLCRDLAPSDQYARALNAMVTALQSRLGADASLAYLAYSDTIDPPTSVTPHNGLFLEYAPIARNLSQPIWVQPASTRQLLAWVSSGWNMSRAQVLDYWLDDSLASLWRRGHQQKLNLHPAVVRQDATFYRDDIGFGSITTFGAWLNQSYVQRFGQPPFKEFGDALCPDELSSD
jgi:hypothetical protein